MSNGLRRPTGRIAFATIEALTLGGSTVPEAYLEAALRPGTTIERHNRVWRMGQHAYEGTAIVGRIGFESPRLTEVWDEQEKDFHEEYLALGFTSPFAIDPATLRVAFQLRGRDIRAKSFTGALQALMNAASPTETWRVHREIARVAFADWVRDVDRIVLLRVVAERPNPNYRGRERVEAIVEGTNAQLAELQLRADDDDPQGLDINDALVQEFIAHAAEYGRYSAVADRGPEQLAWQSAHEGASEVRRAVTDPKTSEVSSQALRYELGDETVGRELADEARAALEDETGRDPQELLEEIDEDDAAA